MPLDETDLYTVQDGKSAKEDFPTRCVDCYQLNPKPEEEVMADKQYKQLGCLDVQPSGGCGFQVRTETEAELMQLVATHAKQCHKLDSIPQEMAAKVKSAIKTVTVTV